MKDLLETARLSALAGAEVLKERAGAFGAARAKSSFTDFVTDSDIASGVAAVRAIAARHEGARFVVEEREVYEIAGVGEASLSDPEVWVIDPLDGTTSYMHGFPCYSVSVALLVDGRPVAGAVYNIPADEMCTAAEGMGARMNGQPVYPSSVEEPEHALIVTGFPYDRTEPLRRQLALLARALGRVQGIRRDGSAAVDCCHVACGRADGYWELQLSPWDLAAGAVILREAGALFTGLDGCDWTPRTRDVLAANPALHPKLMAMLSP